MLLVVCVHCNISSCVCVHACVCNILTDLNVIVISSTVAATA